MKCTYFIHCWVPFCLCIAGLWYRIVSLTDNRLFCGTRCIQFQNWLYPC
jgi:hypothetical protein